MYLLLGPIIQKRLINRLLMRSEHPENTHVAAAQDKLMYVVPAVLLTASASFGHTQVGQICCLVLALLAGHQPPRHNLWEHIYLALLASAEHSN
jgi:hypothetical protein